MRSSGSFHAPRRPPVPDRPDPPPLAPAGDGGRHRRGAGDLEALSLSRHRRPDRPAGADPRRGGLRLCAGGRVRPAAADADRRRAGGGDARRPMGVGPRRPGPGARRPGPDRQDRRGRARAAAAAPARRQRPHAAQLDDPRGPHRCGRGAGLDPLGPQDRAGLSRRRGPPERAGGLAGGARLPGGLAPADRLVRTAPGVPQLPPRPGGRGALSRRALPGPPPCAPNG